MILRIMLRLIFHTRIFFYCILPLRTTFLKTYLYFLILSLSLFFCWLLCVCCFVFLFVSDEMINCCHEGWLDIIK